MNFLKLINLRDLLLVNFDLPEIMSGISLSTVVFASRSKSLPKNSQPGGLNFVILTWERLYNKHEIFEKIKNEIQPPDLEISIC